VSRRAWAVTILAGWVLFTALALAACGLAISGRVEVGDDVGAPTAATPCPQAIE
jgi:hypothetical protein